MLILLSLSSKLSSWDYRTEPALNEILFTIHLEDSLSKQIRILYEALKIQTAGAMQLCECFSEMAPDWHVTNIEASTVYNFNKNYPAGSIITDLIIGRLKSPFVEGSNLTGTNLENLPLLTHNLLYGTSSDSEPPPYLIFDFLLKEIPQNGSQRIALKFTFRNGKVINALSPEYNIES